LVRHCRTDLFASQNELVAVGILENGHRTPDFVPGFLTEGDALRLENLAVAKMSSHQKEIGWNWPMRASWPFGVNNEMPDSAPGISNSIHRCSSLNG